MSLPSGPSSVVSILRELAACPTAPVHEAYVVTRVLELCREFGLSWRADAYGNLFIRPFEDSDDRKRLAGGRPIAFCAHMDHPAFEVVETEPLTALLLGGVRAECFERPVPVRLIRNRQDGGEVAGRITGHFKAAGGTHLRLEADAPVKAGTFGVFDVGGFREEGDLLYQPAADDQAGCAAILSALVECRRRNLRADVLGVLTRCEETGLVGATLVARDGTIARDAIVVSLEASRAMPGAELGGGPVIRVGDRTTAFHHEGDALLRRAAARLTREYPGVAVQRQLMSGGTCEATAFILGGYAATGVAFPLGNYHNVGPDLTIQPEYIHRKDLETGASLLVAAAEEAASPAGPDETRTRLEARAATLAERLKATATWSR